MNADELIVKKGDPIRPAWERLIEWIRGLKVITGPNIRLNVTPQGVIATVDRVASPYGHPWKVSAGHEIHVRAGTVRNHHAVIYNDGELGRLDGRHFVDGSKEFNTDFQSAPYLQTDFNKVDEEGKFYVVVNIALDGDNQWAEDDLYAVSVTQEDHIPKHSHPLACVYLDESRRSVAEVFQIAMHNLDFKTTLTPGTEATVDRIVYFPV